MSIYLSIVTFDVRSETWGRNNYLEARECYFVVNVLHCAFVVVEKTLQIALNQQKQRINKVLSNNDTVYSKTWNNDHFISLLTEWYQIPM